MAKKDSQVTKFLKSAISNLIHRKRTLLNIKSISEIDKIEARSKLIKCKQAYIKVTKQVRCYSTKEKIFSKKEKI